jgi:hypothetical protein
VKKHVCLKEQAICETAFFVESLIDTTRSAWRDIDCRSCLLQGIAASEARTQLLRDFLAVVDAAPSPNDEDDLS